MAMPERWIYSDNFADGDLETTDTLAWTVESQAPTGVANVSGDNTQCTMPKANTPVFVNFLCVQLRDSDNDDNLVDQFILTCLSPDVEYRLYANKDEYVVLSYYLSGIDGITPTMTVESCQTSSNSLTGMFLEIRPFPINMEY